jgi:hypothetical protein
MERANDQERTLQAPPRERGEGRQVEEVDLGVVLCHSREDTGDPQVVRDRAREEPEGERVLPQDPEQGGVAEALWRTGAEIRDRYSTESPHEADPALRSPVEAQYVALDLA